MCITQKCQTATVLAIHNSLGQLHVCISQMLHRKECPLEMIQCEYHNVGCEVRMACKDQEEHKNENMEEHLMKTSIGIKRQQLPIPFPLPNIKTQVKG